MPELKTSSFQFPNGKTVQYVIVRDAAGRIQIRRPEELVKRPTPPAPEVQK